MNRMNRMNPLATIEKVADVLEVSASFEINLGNYTLDTPIQQRKYKSMKTLIATKRSCHQNNVKNYLVH